MATVVLYNGVQLYNVVTRKWDQDIVYDDTGTDPMLHRFSLEFEGTIHGQAQGQLSDPDPGKRPTTFVGLPNAPTTEAVPVYKAVASRLSEPRHRLQVYFGVESDGTGGTLVLDVQPATETSGQNMDVSSGPKPRGVHLIRTYGRNAFRLRFAIECDILTCKNTQYTSGGEELQGMVLSNRWRIAEELDANFFTTRTIDGRMRLARGITTPTQGTAGHFFKSLIVPGLEGGFRREKIDFAVEPDGLTCVYSVIDKQVHTAAPWPATKMDVTHSESTSDGSTFFSTISVKLEGPPHADKREMLKRIIDIADKKIKLTSVDNLFIENLEIIDHIGEANVVEANFRVRHVQNDAREAITRLQVDTWGDKLDLSPIPIPVELEGDPQSLIYDPRQSPVPALYGYEPHDGVRTAAILFFLHCYLQDPCEVPPVHNIGRFEPTIVVTNTPSSGRQETYVQERSPGELDQLPLDSLSESTQTGMYTFATIANRYVTHRMRSQMPISRQTGNSGATAVLFDLAEPQMYRVMQVDVERLGSPPRVPEPVDSYTFGNGRGRAVLKDHTFEPLAPILSPDATQLIYRVRASYWYMMDRPLRNDEEARIERHHLIDPEFAPYTKKPEDYYVEVTGVT